MEILTVILGKLILPMKILAMALLSVLARIFHDKEKITFALVFTRIIMSIFVLMISYFILRELVNFSEELSLMIAGGLSFSFREVMDTFLVAVKNPLSWKEILKNINKKK